MSKRILITGGAGFIGSHLADELLAHGYQVRALDNLTPQVHGTPVSDSPRTHGREGAVGTRGGASRPDYLNAEVELQLGDMRDAEAVARALRGVDAVFHLAAAVGVGQSMSQIVHYTAVNTLGTAVLLEALAARPVERLIVASSMSLYGEGLYRAADGRHVAGAMRDLAALRASDWDVHGADGLPLTPLPTPESTPPSLQSVYALSKFDQERLSLIAGRAQGMETVALRFFNTYGPRQALTNPYTGVLAIFAARLLAGRPPSINEDGAQQRDFVSVHDLARACRLTLEIPASALGDDPWVFNVGSGQARTVREVASRLAEALDVRIEPEITGAYRAGDIRHCFADITRARRILGFEPRVRFADGLIELAEWLAAHGPTLMDRREPSLAGGVAR